MNLNFVVSSIINVIFEINCLLGFYGEAVPVDSGLVTLIKGHGSFNPDGNQRINFRDKTTPDHLTSDEIRKTDNNAILLIRNPYKVIYSYRNYVDKGSSDHKGSSRNWRLHADEDRFFGTGEYRIYGYKLQCYSQNQFE